MTNYIPPHPFRSLNELSTIELLRKGRENLLSIWSEGDFQKDLLTTKILGKHRA